MSCWVVPAIAAELWGVTVSHVLAGVRDGTVTSRQEHGFLFVDVAPASHTYHRPRRPGEPPPPTFVLVQPSEESTAPDEPVSFQTRPDEPLPLRWIEPSSESEPAAEDPELPPLDVEEDDTPLPPRDAIRAAVARQRRRPPLAA